MTRKLGRLLVVALVVAAVVAPMSVASADVVTVPACHDIPYDATNPYHIMITDINFSIKTYVDQWALWDARHHAGDPVTAADLTSYLNFNMMQVVRQRVAAGDLAQLNPGTNHYVLFYDDTLEESLGLNADIPLRINGTRWDDIMCGSPGDDVIRGLRGNDIIYGGPMTGEYADHAYGDDDIITGGPGDDYLVGGYGADAIEGRGGNDWLFGTGGIADAEEFPTPFSTARADGYYIGNFNDLWGGNGNDTILTGARNDEGTGGPGADVLMAPDDLDCVGAEPGMNMFNGQGGADIIKGGSCDDTIYGGNGDDTIWGQSGIDTIYGDRNVASVPGGNDVIYGTEPLVWYDTTLALVEFGDVIYGEAGNDTLYGDAGDDTCSQIVPGAGDDVVVGGPGNDTLCGGLGNDTIYGGYNVLPTGVLATADDGLDNLYGDEGNDTLYGGTQDDYLFGDGTALYAGLQLGLEGSDTLYGGAGSDKIKGGAKADTLYGDAGDDYLYGGYDDVAFESGDAAVDKMYGGAGNDDYRGKCADLDEAYEAIGGGIDTTHFIKWLVGEFEFVLNACT